MRIRSPGLAGLLALGAAGCPARQPRPVVYDLAQRLPVADRWSSREVLLFGSPAAEPHQVEGFYAEAGGGQGETFLWTREEAEVSLTWAAAGSRAVLLDLAPYGGVASQGLDVRLNGRSVAQFPLSDLRHRYRVALPAADQKSGENRIRFVFRASASPSDRDPRNPDRRHLAAAFYSLVLGDGTDPSLEDLLVRDAPRPFGVSKEGRNAPALDQVGPSIVRYALRLPEGAELRFTPDLHPAARAAAGAALLKVTLEARPGEERELWSRTLTARDRAPSEVVLALPGRPGDIVRLGLHVAPRERDRFAWGVWREPRILGIGGTGDLLQGGPAREARSRGADALRESLAGSNVILIILDAARAAELGCYGYGRATTPEIDRIASEGVLFADAFTPAVYTLGAMASIWTSQHPDRHHGAVSFADRLPADRLTLADILTARQIHTAGFVANAVAGTAFGFERGFDEFHEVFKEYGSGAGSFRKVLPAFFKANTARRFFAYVHFREPHFPYDPPVPFDTRFGPDAPLSRRARVEADFLIRDVNQERRALSRDERDHLVRLYDGNLAFADQEIGALRKTLEEEGLWERSVVIVAADHGEELYEHGWIGHNVHLFEESAHVPLIIRLPAGRGPRGLRVKGLVDLLDLAPTIADVFGFLGQGGSNREFQGRSLLPVVAGGPERSAGVLARTVWDRPRYALRDERFKFLYDTRTGEGALYDLELDPGETRDVQGEAPLRAAYYRQTLHQWIASLARPSHEGTLTGPPPTCEQCQNLKALGYLGADFKCPCPR